LQSLVGLYPLVAADEKASIVRPARCLYTFCRLTSIVVVNARSHIIVAGSEMGSLLVWDLRNRSHSPAEYSRIELDKGPKSEPKADQDVAHFEGSVWLTPVFSTDSFAISSTHAGAGDDDENASDLQDQVSSSNAGISHGSEIRCLRCSEGQNSDSLIFAMDAEGVTTFWRVLELAAESGMRIKLAFQGSMSIGNDVRSLCHFLDATYLCVHPQQSSQFVVISASGVSQTCRQRINSVADGPRSLELLDTLAEDFRGCLEQPVAAAFNPFFPGLLLVAYVSGDLALFDCTLCVPIVHWAGAISQAPCRNISVAWSPVRPCVFFVKADVSLDVWDLSEKAHLPVQTVDLNNLLKKHGSGARDGGFDSLVCCELSVSTSGQPVVSYKDVAVVLKLPVALTKALQEVPQQHRHGESTVDALVKDGHETVSVFPTLQRHCRQLSIAQPCVVERDLLRHILAGIQPLQAWA